MFSSEDLTASQGGHDTDYEPSSVEEQEQSSGNESFQVRWVQIPEEERQSVHQREEDQHIIDNELPIPLVQERVALWDPVIVIILTRRLWEEVARSLLDDWDHARQKVRKDFLKRVKLPCRSIKAHFNKDIRQEMQVKSFPKLSKYKYNCMLSFLRPALAQRTTWRSTIEHGSFSIEAAPHRPANEQSQSSTSDVATRQASQAGEQAAGPSGFSFSQPSATAFVGISHQRQRAWERSVMPEFIHLSSVFQDGMKVIGDRLDSGLTPAERHAGLPGCLQPGITAAVLKLSVAGWILPASTSTASLTCSPSSQLHHAPECSTPAASSIYHAPQCSIHHTLECSTPAVSSIHLAP
ncbi:uncharacterized protein LOC143764811 [Ranitomeya variabilis]|uniref:uncharacterized protein LOC143764811 n=1 Tax=Ranitomeya variabilis TaxID=490064 RepID=UPI0040576FFC